MAAVHGYFPSLLPPLHQNHVQRTLTFTKLFVSKPMNFSFESQRHLAGRIVCAAENEKVGFFGRLGRVIKEKAKSDVERLFSGFSKTRDNLAVVDELLTYWNLADTDQVLDELEEALLVSDFGPKTAIKIVENLRKEILAGNLKSGQEIKVALKKKVIDLLKQKVQNTELQLGLKKPAVVLVVGVNGGGKTTSIGKLAYKLQNEGKKFLDAHPLQLHPGADAFGYGCVRCASTGHPGSTFEGDQPPLPELCNIVKFQVQECGDNHKYILEDINTHKVGHIEKTMLCS